MISAIKSNIIAFLKTKSIKNYFLILELVFISSIIILTIINYCNYKIENFINNESNKVINVQSTKENHFILDNILKNYSIKNIEYNLVIPDVVLFDQKYVIMSSSSFAEDNYAIKISQNLTKKNIKIFNYTISKIIYDENIGSDTIYINQKLSHDIYEDNIGNGLILVELNNYNDVDQMVKDLSNNNIQANKNNDVSESINYYQNIKYVLTIFFTFASIGIFIIITYLNINICMEQKRNMYIYNLLGYPSIYIGIIYILTFSIIMLISYLIAILLTLLFIIPITIIFDYMILKAYLTSIYMPLLIMIVINIFSVLFSIKKIKK